MDNDKFKITENLSNKISDFGGSEMEKIKMVTPLVEMDGDEMTRILWQMIKDELINPFVELKTLYFDLGLKKREETKDQITIDSALAAKKYGVAVKCATITPNKQRVEEYNLSEMWKSPNGTIRAILDGTVFRSPIIIDSIKPLVKNWKKPITIARHAYGDIYKGTEYRVLEPGKAELIFTGDSGTTFRETIYDFECPGVLQGLYNKDSSIESFAHSCFKYAISVKQDLWFSTKDTISKKYDQTFKLMFEDIYNKYYKEEFEKLGITYFYTLIDDAVARVIRSEGGFIWACKNYDGDVMSDMISTAFGSFSAISSAFSFVSWLRRSNPAPVITANAAMAAAQSHVFRRFSSFGCAIKRSFSSSLNSDSVASNALNIAA